jgi:hypothetical protein
MKFGNKQTMKDKYAVAEKRGYDTGKPSTGSKPAPKAKISLKGTNPLKKKATVTVKKDW